MTTVKDAGQAFLSACGATGPIRLRVERPPQDDIEEMVLRRPFAVVGSTPGADVRLDASAASKRQAYLQVLEGHTFCIPLDTHTTLLPPNQPGAAGWLDERQTLRLGPDRWCLLTAESDHPTSLPPEINPLASGSSAHLPLPSITLEFRQGEHRQSHWRMDRLLALVGRSPACKIRLEHSRVSRLHCSLVLTSAGPWLVDLLGWGGVRVNGARVRFCRLADGDEIELSVFCIRCHYDSPAPGRVIAFKPTGSGRALAPVTRLAPPGEPFDPSEPPPLPPLAPLAPEHDSALALRSLVGPLVEQFNQMQGQLFDQFQQAMLQMFHIFSAVQNDQMKFIREELDRLRDLTHELHGLQVQLAKSASAEPAQKVREAPPCPATTSEPDRAPQPVPSPSAATNGSIPHPANGEARPRPSDSGAARATDDGTDLHTLLCQRVEKLQQERQGRWQRLLDCLFGKRPGDGVP
ncbi:MAG: FHA domain-containing protein [Gemmataceae bacterium]|nr:FHA domain-containing protein [Gemmataceae bacterium]